MDEETDPDLFIEAQDTVWPNVLKELRAGEKTTHWMWFVFPQLAELGQSDISQLYGLHDLSEARAYLANPTLQARLVEAAALTLGHPDKSARQIFGRVDAAKLCSCMTLFAAVPGAPDVFQSVLDRFFDGTPCPKTIKLIKV
ncbi:DUF1810 domain-containing protein [Pontibaca salina]|uniref:DUF1810 domain-containing protein n=1 Tax=Pontibaca salina TaxID=2795731 RepID=A0A934HJQ8_9RHOB|nr:DUF1810 domain-containing protein [Pontibaca salina]MBI6629403.1 DUF1810 domain-containing protein [Pontibaca salina]